MRDFSLLLFVLDDRRGDDARAPLVSSRTNPPENGDIARAITLNGGSSAASTASGFFRTMTDGR